MTSIWCLRVLTSQILLLPHQLHTTPPSQLMGWNRRFGFRFQKPMVISSQPLAGQCWNTASRRRIRRSDEWIQQTATIMVYNKQKRYRTIHGTQGAKWINIIYGLSKNTNKSQTPGGKEPEKAQKRNKQSKCCQHVLCRWWHSGDGSDGAKEVTNLQGHQFTKV